MSTASSHESQDVVDFDEDVLERSHRVPVVADFWAAWCGPCRLLGPVLEKLADDAEGRWVLAKVDTERHPGVAARYGVRGIPAVKLFVDAQVVDEFVGALPEDAVRRWLQRALPSPELQRLGRARKLAGQGREDEARERLEQAFESHPDDAAVRVELASALLIADPARARELVEPIGVASEHGDRADAVATLADLLLRRQGAETLPAAAVRDLYAAALDALARAEWDAAVQGFIDVIGRDRAYDDDGARRACLAVFRLLGEEHPVTRKHRMAFGSAVHA